LVPLFFVFPARANEIVAAGQALSGDEITLHDGRVLRLGGVKAASPEAKAFLDSHVSGKALVLQDATTDRYGRVRATASVDGSPRTIEEELLREGLAFVYPAVGEERLEVWLAAEHEARVGKHGFWADTVDVASNDAPRLYGKYGFVVGCVAKAERVGNKVYLSFGAQERPEFTIALALSQMRTLKRQGVDALSLQGKKVRVRGWVTKGAGPTVTLTDSHQLELAE
jgi:hypothetical protein